MNISNELKEIKQNEFLEKKRRQQLRLECEELRQLESQLRVAYISKELSDQIAAAQKVKEEAERAKQLERGRVETERQKALEERRIKEESERRRKEALCHSLHDQFNENHKKRLQAYQGLVDERDRRNAMQRRIDEEDKLMEKERELQMTKTRQQLEEFKDLQVAYKAREKAQAEEEREKILQYQREVDEKERLSEKRKLEMLKLQQAEISKLGQKVYQLEDDKRRRDQVLQELLQFEYKAKEDERFRARLEQEQRKREQIKLDLQHFRQEVLGRNQEAARLKREEHLQCRKLAQEEAAKKLDEKQELEMLQKRKEHGTVLMNMIEENKRKRAMEMTETVQYFENKNRLEQERQQMVEEERIKMLRSLPPDVFRHLPNGVLRDTDRYHLPLPKGK